MASPTVLLRRLLSVTAAMHCLAGAHAVQAFGAGGPAPAEHKLFAVACDPASDAQLRDLTRRWSELQRFATLDAAEAAAARTARCQLCSKNGLLLPCHGCGVRMFCSPACRERAFEACLVHAVSARVDSAIETGGKRATLLCGGDPANAIRGEGLCEDTMFCTSPASRALGHGTEERVLDGETGPRLLSESNTNCPAATPRSDTRMDADMAARTLVAECGEMGRVLLAAADFRPGDIVLQEPPLLVWPTGVSSQVAYYQGVLDAYTSASAATRAEVSLSPYVSP